MSRFIAIDFGTSQSAIAILREDDSANPEIIQIDGHNAIQTALQLDKNGDILRFGAKALEEDEEENYGIFTNFKPFVGQAKTFANADHSRSFTADELSLKFLSILREKLENGYFGKKKLSDMPDLYCVIGSPAEWDEKRKAKMVDIAEKAGFPRVIRCDEPISVIYYCYHQNNIEIDRAKKILVYDFGGGTTDIALELIYPLGDKKEPENISTGGNNFLGGRQFDEVIYKHLTSTHNISLDMHSINGRRDSDALHYHAKKLKEELSAAIKNGKQSADSTISYLYSVGKHGVKLKLDRNDYDNISKALIDSFKDPINKTLNRAGLSCQDIDYVILAGGSSNLPHVRQQIDEMFDSSKIIQCASTDDIAKGLVIYLRENVLEKNGPLHNRPKKDSKTEDVNDYERIGTLWDTINKVSIWTKYKKHIIAAVVVLLIARVAISTISDYDNERTQFQTQQQELLNQKEKLEQQLREQRIREEQERRRHQEYLAAQEAERRRQEAERRRKEEQNLHTGVGVFGGAAGGAAAGAAIGSLVPGIGTLIGGAVGGVVGGIGGAITGYNW